MIYGSTISPEVYKEKPQQLKETRVVGHRTVVTKKGDTIQVPIYKEFEATVVYIEQHKEAHVKGEFRIWDAASNMWLVTEPFQASGVFHHEGYVIEGDKEIVPDKIKKQEIPGPAPYPPNEQMLADAFMQIKNMLTEFIKKNRQILLQ